MYEHGALGLAFTALNSKSDSDDSQLGDQQIIKFYYPKADHIFLLFRRNDNQAIGIFDLSELTEETSEMSAYIRNGFEIYESVFIDFFSGLILSITLEQQPFQYGVVRRRQCFSLWASNHLMDYALLRFL